jgi:hypothetical protein
LTFVVAPNTTGAARTIFITITDIGNTLTVKQSS